MIHVALSIVVKSDISVSAKKRRSQVEACGGLMHIASSDYREAAQNISKLPWVERVIATSVSEVNVGTWREGKLA